MGHLCSTLGGPTSSRKTKQKTHKQKTDARISIRYFIFIALQLHSMNTRLSKGFNDHSRYSMIHMNT